MIGLGLHLVRGLMGRRARWEEETGAVATEYGLILTFIAVVIVAAVIAFGVILNGMYESAAPALSGS